MEEQAHDFVGHILTSALQRGASDVYLIPSIHGVNVRMRIDGVDEDVVTLPTEYGTRCVARLKVLAGLLTYITKTPQDGAIRDLPDASKAELRVAVVSTNCGERVAIRLMQSGSHYKFIDDLVFPDAIIKLLRRALELPSGLIILTGPTGSGKSTTIYALVRELLRHQHDPASILTIEDPIECRIDSISQISVAGTSQGGYASALRAVLRQDVKTIVIGEMRDREVVQVTIDAALTGHRVITTYHAGDIPGVYARLLHAGIESFLVAAAVTAVLTQRLLPSGVGNRRVPMVAGLLADDGWRDFVASNPGLVQLRRRIQDYPEADLHAAAAQMTESGRIPRSIRV